MAVRAPSCRRMLRIGTAVLLVSTIAGAVVVPGSVFAQPAEPAPRVEVPPADAGRAGEPGKLPETFEIGLSAETIVITSNFSGTRLVVFGALDNADQRILRQGGYDIVTVLEGPKSPIIVREKERVLGFWINRGAERFDRVPSSYTLASTRRLSDVAPTSLLRQLSIGVDHMQFGDPLAIERPSREIYDEALRRIRSSRGLYEESIGAVEFVSATLFRADLPLPANLPVGRHVARAFLFRNGVLLRERSLPLSVVKSGFEASVSNFAARHGVVYGILAVALAIVTGWLGRVIFPRD